MFFQSIPETGAWYISACFFVWPFCAAYFVLRLLAPNRPPNPLPRGLVQGIRHRLALNFFSQKSSETLSTTAKSLQNSSKKRAQGDSNESLWTLKFYSETYLKRCPERTKLGAELGRFWVGQGHGDSEKFTCYKDYNISRSKYQVKFVWPVIFKILG